MRRSIPVAIVVMLASAIGAAAAIFGIAHAVLLRPLPVAEEQRLLVLWGRDPARSQSVVEVGLADLDAWRRGGTRFESIEVFGSVNWGEARIKVGTNSFAAAQNAVSAGFFDALGARPALGRTFTASDDRAGAPLTLVISHDLWRTRFSSDPTTVGSFVTYVDGADTAPAQIIGVMPAGFRIPEGADVWFPAVRELGEIARRNKTDTTTVRVFYAIARLKPGAAVKEAVSELSAVALQQERQNGNNNSRMEVVATSLTSHLLGPARPALAAIAGASFMLLLIACANAAGLLLVRGTARRQEVAIRLALGAGRWRVVRQFLKESAVLAASAGLLGIALAYIAFDLLVALAPVEVPRLDDAAIDGRVLLFIVAVSAAATIAIGLLPAWQCTSGRLLPALYQHTRGNTLSPSGIKVRKALVAVQLTAAVVLLAGAGLFMRSFVSLMRQDLGFDPDRVLTFQVSAASERYPDLASQRVLADAVVAQVEAVPGVVAAGAIYERPFAHGPIGMDAGVHLEGQPTTAEAETRNPIVNWEPVTPGYFAAMDIRLVSGRLFDARDDERAPTVVIVSRALAARLWPGQPAIGKRLLTHGARGDRNNFEWQTVVGVVEDARYREIQAARYDLYLPHRQAPNPVPYFVVRTAGEPLAIIAAIEAAIARIDPEVKPSNVTTMERVVERVMAPWRFGAFVVTVFGVLAMSFAAIGLAAIVAFAVSERTREIGVRIALGAQSRHVVGLMLRESAFVVLGGLAAGVAAAWLATRSLSAMLVGISPTDPASYAAASVVFILVSFAAAYLPARRAASIAPIAALKHE